MQPPDRLFTITQKEEKLAEMLHHFQFVLTDSPFCPIRQAEMVLLQDEGVFVCGEITIIFLR